MNLQGVNHGIKLRQRDISDNGARRGNNREGLDREPRCVVYFEVIKQLHRDVRNFVFVIL